MGSAKTPVFIFCPRPRIWLETPTFSQSTYTYILSVEKVCVSFFRTGLKKPGQPCKAIILLIGASTLNGSKNVYLSL
jgi:hypothetical protein